MNILQAILTKLSTPKTKSPLLKLFSPDTDYPALGKRLCLDQLPTADI